MTDTETKLAKLLELARRGVGGEADNAKRLLDKMLNKHGLAVEDIEGDKKEFAEFPLKSCDVLKRLLVQIIAHVCGKDVKFYSSRLRKNKTIAKVTVAERMEIELLWDAHLKNYTSELNTFYTAYIHRHRLFPADGNVLTEDELTDEQRESREKMGVYASTMDAVTIRKQLHGKMK